MRDVARPDAACDAQDALDEDFAGGPQADGRGEFSAGVGDGTSTQMPGRRTPAKAMLPQSSSWPECSTMRGGAIVPKVTGPKEIRPKLSAGRRRDGLALRQSCKGTAEPCPVKATFATTSMRSGDDDGDGGGDDVRRQRQGWHKRAQGERQRESSSWDECSTSLVVEAGGPRFGIK